MAEAAKMEMALDDIIQQSKPAGGRRGRGRAGGNQSFNSGRASSRGLRSGGRGRANLQAVSFPRARNTPEGRWSHDLQARNTPEGRWSHDRFSEGFRGGRNFGLRSASSTLNDTTKLLISNLDFGVSDSDVKELFSEFGPLRRAAVHYDKTARSLGSADVVFERRADALRAVKQYNGVPLDGRPMKIQMVTVQANSAPASTNFGNNRMRGIGGGGRRDSGPGPRRSRGGGGRGRGAGRGRDERNPVTQEQLDADLDAYISKV